MKHQVLFILPHMLRNCGLSSLYIPYYFACFIW